MESLTACEGPQAFARPLNSHNAPIKNVIIILMELVYSNVSITNITWFIIPWHMKRVSTVA